MYESDVTLSVSDICTIRLPSQQMFGGCMLGSDCIELSGRYIRVKSEAICCASMYVFPVHRPPTPKTCPLH